jgi:hypothetical protein
MFVKKMVLHIINTIRFVRTDLDALLLNAGFANPTSDDTATLGLLDIVARIPDPRARVFCSLQRYPGKKRKTSLSFSLVVSDIVRLH